MLARSILASFALSLLGSCGSTQTSPEQTDVEPIPTKPRQQTYEDKDGVSEKGKEWGGWRWKGNREDCFFKIDRQCFATKKDACKAAGCPKKGCTGDSSAPVKISCIK